MTEQNPPTSQYLMWAIAYVFVMAVSALLSAGLTGMAQHHSAPLGYFSLPWHWAVAPESAWVFSILRLPVVTLEVILLAYLYRLGSSSWRLWGLGISLPIGLELVRQALWGGDWLRHGIGWLWLWRDPPRHLIPFDWVWRNAISNLVPPFVAGIFVTWLAYRQAKRHPAQYL